MKLNKPAGIGMAIFGFALILLNALAYLTHTKATSPSALVMGLVLLVAGVTVIRKSPTK